MDSVDLLLHAAFGIDPATLEPVVDRARPSIRAVDTLDAYERARVVQAAILEAVGLGYETLAAIGSYTGQPRTTLRTHIARLVETGAVVERKTDDRSKRGRPKFVYRPPDGSRPDSVFQTERAKP